jgi:pimeloyl-ACP methyl ester carboxylesterase
MIAAEWDPVLRPELVEVMRPLVDDLETHVVPACGHWTPQEKPEEVNRLLIDWLRRRFAAPA